MKVEDIMTKRVETCSMDTDLHSAALAMWQNDCGCLPVTDSRGCPIGMVTDRDIVMGAVLQHRPLWEMTVADITQGHTIHRCQNTDDVHDALKCMQKHKVRRLPVIHHSGTLAGIVSMGDILARADLKSKTELSMAEMLSMLKTVTAHHGALVRMA